MDPYYEKKDCTRKESVLKVGTMNHLRIKVSKFPENLARKKTTIEEVLRCNEVLVTVVMQVMHVLVSARICFVVLGHHKTRFHKKLVLRRSRNHANVIYLIISTGYGQK